VTPSAQAVTQLALDALMEMLCAEPAMELAGEFEAATTAACCVEGTIPALGSLRLSGTVTGRTGRDLEEDAGIEAPPANFRSGNDDAAKPPCAACCGSLLTIAGSPTEFVALFSAVLFVVSVLSILAACHTDAAGGALA
jgi:hypothetical protein